jgi:type III secretion system low calcium response chaperone LcrH/SycD
MTATHETEVDAKAQELLDVLSKGGTVGSFAGFGKDELEAVYAVAHAQFAAQKYDKAIHLLQFLCLNDHTNPRWFYSLGIAQQKNGDFAAAVESYAVSTILDVDDPRPQMQAGYCLMALDKLPEAKSALEGALMVCKEFPNEAVRAQAEARLERANTRLAGEGK